MKRFHRGKTTPTRYYDQSVLCEARQQEGTFEDPFETCTSPRKEVAIKKGIETAPFSVMMAVIKSRGVISKAGFHTLMPKITFTNP